MPNPVRTPILGASLLALATALVTPSAAFAQDQAASVDSGNAEAAVEDIVVTGSRIAASGFAAPTPVTVVGQQDLQRQAATNVAELLNTLPAFRPQGSAATVGIFSANAGANLADLRGLGANRTLVLVDGRRFVASTVAGSSNFASPANAVDMSLIPTVMISRTEVVTGGASAAYGSDAVAGVVNLIIDDHMEGLRGSVQGGFSNQGDNTEFMATLAGGTSFSGGRGHIVIGGEYSKSGGVGDCYTREWCAISYNTISNPTPAVNGLARQVILPNSRPSTATFGGIITSGVLKGTEFGPGSTYFPHDYGTFFGAGIFQSGGGADPVNGFYNNYPLVAPVERLTFMGNASYDITDNASLFMQASYGKVNSSTLGASSRNLGNITIQRDNAYLPAALRAKMLAAGQTSFLFGRIADDIGPPVADVSRETYRIVTGAKGDAGILKWDLYYQYGRTNYSQTTTNTQITDNFARAVDAVDQGLLTTGVANGNIVCRTTITQPGNPLVAGCKPLNLFGQNMFDPAAVAYAYGTAWQKTHISQHVAALNLQADLAQLQGGALSVAGGAEYRVEDVEGTADEISKALRFLTSPGQAITGPAIKVKEAYVEVGAPVLADRPFVNLLSFNGAARITDYSSSGSVTTWKLGTIYEPADFLRFRATWSRDIRAANFFELYAPTSVTYQLITDPVKGNASALPQVHLGGNPDLKPEKADTFTVGGVLSPMPGMKLSVDYYNIRLNGAITTYGGQVIVTGCYNGNAALCSLITRDADKNLVSIDNYNYNIAQLKTRGIDGEFSWQFPLAKGDFTLRALGTYVINLITTDTTGSVDRAGQNGGPVSQPSGLPRFTGNLSGTYSQGPFSGTLQARYVSPGRYNKTLIGPDEDGYSPTLANSVSDNEVNAYWLFNLSVSMDVINDGAKKLQWFGTINNLFDRDPPNDLPSSFGVTNPVLYDVIGRQFRVGLRFTY